MSTDDETRYPDATGAPRPTDAGGRGLFADGAVAASGEVGVVLAGIESLPLADRAAAYQSLADRLRAELEESDPSRGQR